MNPEAVEAWANALAAVGIALLMWVIALLFACILVGFVAWLASFLADEWRRHRRLNENQ